MNKFSLRHTILCTTAISRKEASLDKSSSSSWEEYILSFSKKRKRHRHPEAGELISFFFLEFVSTHFY